MKMMLQQSQPLHLRQPQAREWPVQVAPVQGRVYGPQQEPERYPNPYVMNYGQNESSGT